MDGEMGTFIKIWGTAALSGCYCYALSKSTAAGLFRLLLILPVAAFFTAAPYPFYSCNLGGTTWFFLTWLGISKLLLFAFGGGPLSQLPPLSLLHFISTLLFPIKVKRPGPGPGPIKDSARLWRWGLFGVKLAGFGCVIEAFNYRETMSYWGLLGLYCCHLYLSLEILLVVSGALAGGTLGLQLAPQADAPYLSTSLQDFWGRRWNLMVSDILRQTVHNPIRRIASPLIGKKPAILVGVVASFLVSGLMHEWVFCISTRVAPTWEVTCFFILHAACLVIELIIKMAVSDKWRLHPAISGPLTVGFVAVTAVWLFFPPLVRNNMQQKAIHEYVMAGKFVKRNLMYLFRS